MSKFIIFQIFGRLGQENIIEQNCCGNFFKLCLALFHFSVLNEMSLGYNLKTLTYVENISLLEVH